MIQKYTKETVSMNQKLDRVCQHGVFIFSNGSALKINFFLLILLSAAVLPGCSLEASLESLTQDIGQILSQKSTSTEVTPSSSQGVLTTKGYEVQSSVSYYNATPETVTNKGYTVQTNVQSTLFKER